MALFPDDEEAVGHLKRHHELTVTVAHLASLRATRPAELQAARDNIAPERERALISDLGDNAALAGMVIKGALKAANAQLEAGNVSEPSRVARDVADVQAKAIDKGRLLRDKPTQITRDISDREFYAIEARLEELVAEADVIEDDETDELPPAAA